MATTVPYQNQLESLLNRPGGSNVDWYQYARNRFQGVGNTGTAPLDWYAAQAGVNPIAAFRGIGTPASEIGYGNLLQLLAQNGRTDPRLMNSIMSGIQRDTQGAQMQAQGQAAAHGFGNSGVNAALQAALGQAGTAKQADVRAQDAALQQQRQMQLQDFFRQNIIQPGTDYAALALGQYGQDKQLAQQNKNAQYGFYGSLLSGLASLFGGH